MKKQYLPVMFLLLGFVLAAVIGCTDYDPDNNSAGLTPPDPAATAVEDAEEEKIVVQDDTVYTVLLEKVTDSSFRVNSVLPAAGTLFVVVEVSYVEVTTGQPRWGDKDVVTIPQWSTSSNPVEPVYFPGLKASVEILSIDHLNKMPLPL